MSAACGRLQSIAPMNRGLKDLNDAELLRSDVVRCYNPLPR